MPLIRLNQLLGFSWTTFLLQARLGASQQHLQPCQIYNAPRGSFPHKSSYKVGVLANRGVAATIEEYGPTTSYLTQEIGDLFDPPLVFDIVPVPFENGESTVEKFESLEYDFIFANPSVVSCVDSSVGIYPLNTAISRREVDGKVYDLTQFGGVIFTMQENDEIWNIEDIRGKSVGCISFSGLGSGQMQFRELMKAGINPFQDVKQLIFMENQNAILEAVINGDIDVGFVRTDLLERNEVDLSSIRVIHAQDDIEVDGRPFPFHISTELYPEWTLASALNVPDAISEAVQWALSQMDEHAAAAPSLMQCMELQQCGEGSNRTQCIDDCFGSIDVSSILRCDTKPETALLAHEALVASGKGGWRSALSLMELRNMQEEIGVIQFDRAAQQTQCIRSTNIVEAIRCPAGHFPKSEDEIERGCKEAGLECFGYQCLCSPCVRTYDVAFEPFYDSINIDGSGCSQFDVCGTVEQMGSISFQAIDNKNRKDAVIVARIIINNDEVEYEMMRVNASHHKGLEPDDLTDTALYELRFDAFNRESGIAIIEVFVDGQPIPQSPFRLEITPRDCLTVTGDVLRVPDRAGNCVCPTTTIEVRGDCVELKVFLPSIFGPFVVFVLLVMFIYVECKRRQSDALWMVHPEDLEFDDPPVVLGKGSFGMVLLADYRGTQVAVKRALPPKSSVAKGDSATNSSNQGLLAIFGLPNSTAPKLSRISEEGEEGSDETDVHGSVPLDEELGLERLRSSITATENLRTSIAGKKKVGNARGRFTMNDIDGKYVKHFTPAATHENSLTHNFMPVRQSPHGFVAGVVSDTSSSPRGITSIVLNSWKLFSKDDYARMQNDLISEMRHLAKLRHPCITTVMGAVMNSIAEPMLVMEHMELGSFYDLLHNDSMMVESEMVLQVLQQVAQGLRFLHTAKPPVIHGDLKAKNILIDSQFRAKVADFGISQGRNQVTGTPYWMAPELLRGYANNSTRSDVYSFGILIYESYSRKVPYEGMEFDEAIRQVTDKNIRLRPPVPQTCPKEVGNLMRQCLRAIPLGRPTANTIDLVLRGVSSDMEHRAEDLLSELFPENIANALRDGQKVKPESHDCVTVFFSDIVGYTKIASTLSPTKVSDLLDRLYTEFDRLCGLYNVFKVETVGDAYMTVTNLASKQDDHVSVMAHFAIEAVNAAASTLIDTDNPSRGNVQIRVGFHSGPVASHVIGSRNPRYSIIGDTVNIASRMESTSKPGRIHCSMKSAMLLHEQSSDFHLVSRGELDIKGKGKMTTFWVRTGELDSEKEESSTCRERDEEHRIKEIKIVHGAELEPGISKEKTRLIDWNVQIIQKYLQRLIAYRRAEGARSADFYMDQSSSGESSSVHDPLEEVVEVIDLPTYDARLARALKHGKNIVLPEDVVLQLSKFVTAISHMYPDNPFHSFQHASHVTQSIDKLLTSVIEPRELQGIDDRRKEFTVHEYTYGISSDPMTHFAVVFSALIHDVDHPGVPNAQLVKENADLASFYKNKSVAEQNSVDLAWNLLMDSGFEALRGAIYETTKERERFRQLVVNTVLATDIVDKELKELRNQRWTLAFSEQALEGETQTNMNRKATVVIEHLIQASDVAHTMQHWHIYRKWNERFFTECYEGFLAGRAEKDPSINWYKGELGFFDFYIIPLTRKLKDCGVFGASSSEYLDAALRNRAEWEIRGQEVVNGMIEKVRSKQAAKGRISSSD